MKVAVVGATGLVGRKMLQVLEERDFPVSELIPVASERSIGKEVTFRGKTHKVTGMQQAIAMRPDIAIFSAGGDTSLEWAPRFAEAGTTVVDNSSAWRMDPTKKLIIPEINADILTAEDKIIANPNCSTIQMLVALAPLHKAYGIRRTEDKYSCGMNWFWLSPRSFSMLYLRPAASNVYTEEYQMPVEECGNMLIMTAAAIMAGASEKQAKKNFPLLKKWVKYLEKYGLKPSNQLCTDDFAGHLSDNVNLAIKALVGIEAFSLICRRLGKDQLAQEYRERRSGLPPRSGR